jgi:cytochrome c-type biogenesis protein CcmH
MSTPPASTPRQLPDVDTMIERLAARLQAQPDDAEGWRMLGWSYFHVEQPIKAAEAYARAVALRPQSAEFNSAYGEALVGAEGGIVTPKTLEAFRGALAIDAQDPRARYFVALSKLQASDKKAAFEDLLGLQADAVGDEAWMIALREQTKALARELNVDLASRGTAHKEGALKVSPQPTPEQVRDFQALPADQRQTAIEQMVEGLARRLQQNPRDEEGWLRLIRSRVVLGELAEAREALKHALATFADDVPAGARITAFAKELGVEN